MTYRVGIDIGGTFTDFALLHGDAMRVEKVLSSPDDPSRAVMRGLEALAESEDLPLRDFLSRVDALVHGTTIADNTLIQMNGARTGLLTTQGFRDELELRRGYKEDIWDVRLPPPPPIVPRRRRLGVPERIGFDGRIEQPLDEEAARRAIGRLRMQGVESVAISTLFSFVEPAHERRLAELVREEMPEAACSLSHEVLPRAPEFERTSTTVVNAYVGPRVTGYLDRLVERLRNAGYERELLVMQCTGGVMTRDYLRGAAVRVLASGPAGGVIGGAHTGNAKQEPDLLCVDMGGTSYDVSVVRRGVAPADAGWNWHHRHLIGLPMVRVETLGAGGGSICSVDDGVLRVGPDSAGADPGPICYGRGGARPTVTDAILLLGLLSDEATFAGGRFGLTRHGVEEAFREQIAEPLGCSAEDAAYDCWRVVNANMTQAVRRLTAERGTDPRHLTMLAYGGNGPAFATNQAAELGIERVWVPRASPTFSALGALAARPSVDEERSLLCPADRADLRDVRRAWRELDDRAQRFLLSAGHDRDEMTARYQINLRYPGQNWSLAIVAAEIKGAHGWDFVAPGLVDAAVRAFHRRHLEEYGHSRENEMPEITGVRLSAWAESPQPAVGGGFTSARRDAQPHARRRARMGATFTDASLFRGSDLAPGHLVRGPAVIEESFTTIVVEPGWQATVDDVGDYLLQRTA